MGRGRRSPASERSSEPDNWMLGMPRDLESIRVAIEGEELCVLTFPVGKTCAVFPSLTPAEQDVARLMLHGYSNKAIAAARSTSMRTVANQVAALFRKLGVRSRSELALLALDTESG